jgi:signal transduction histidine kinase
LYRGDRSRSKRGLGLGLSLVKAMVQAHGGSVRVESASGEGATFYVRIPICTDETGNRGGGTKVEGGGGRSGNNS